MVLLKRFIHHLNEGVRKSLHHSEHQLIAMGALAFFGFPFFYWLWTEVYPQPYETIELRVIGSFLGLGLMLAPKWPMAIKRYLPWYWFITLLFTLTFFFPYYFLKSNATVISAMWMLCSIFLLVLLVDILTLVVMVLLGWGLAFIVYGLTTSVITFHGFHLQYFIIYLFTIVAGCLFNYKTAMLQQQRLDGMAAAAGMIAHELRTPLLGIKSAAEALNQYMPDLIEAYQQAHSMGANIKPIRRGRLTALAPASQRIITEIHYANTIIDMLLIKAGREASLDKVELEPCSMAECISQALARYPFHNNRERELVSWQGDFRFNGSKLLIEHVLFNLLKNALYFIATMQKGEVAIWVSSQVKTNQLHFKDTAKGLSAKESARLFNHFYSTTFGGTGLGLTFCKLVMQRLGGSIHCRSEEGFFTEFILCFPKPCYSNSIPVDTAKL